MGGVDSLYVPLREMDKLLAVVETVAENTTLSEEFRHSLHCESLGES